MGKQPRDEQQQEADATLRTEETQEKGDVTLSRPWPEARGYLVGAGTSE